MRRAILLITVMATAVLFACAGVALAQARAPDAPQLDRYIVVLKDEADPEQKADEAQREHGAKVRHVYDGQALNGYAAVIPAGRLAVLNRDPDVAFIDEDALVYADISTGGATGVDRIDAEPNSTGVSDGNGAKAAVLDTGIDLDHPDLAPNVVNGINAITTTGTPSSDCSVGRTNTSADDDNGHGTHVAGTIGAKNDGTGVVGVAPGANLYAVKVLNAQGSGYVSDIICGINWVTSTRTDADTTNDINTANMSLGGTGSDDGQSCATTTIAYKKAICNSVGAKVTYVVSAGNDGGDLANKRPASYRDGTKPLVLTVTAIADYDGQPGGDADATCRADADDTPASFSNFATTTVDQEHTIAAPGACILSTRRGGGTTTMSGTSMAAPHVAGTVALGLARSQFTDANGDGNVLPEDIIAKLRDDAQAQPSTYWWLEAPGNGDYYGHLEYAGAYRSGAAPDTTITSGLVEGSKTNSTSASFEYSSSEPSSTFECSLDGAAFSSCPDTGQSYSGLGNGQHAFEVRAKNAAGTTDPTPAKRTWTVDTSAPTVSSTNPADGASSVALNTNVTATFSEDMDLSTLTDTTFTLKTPDGSSVSAAVSYDATTKTATLNPSADLAANTTYTATVTTGVKDKAGNALASDKVWSFTTASPDTDTTAPTVTGTSPTNGKTSVGRGTNVTATFSEAIDSATLTKDTFTLVKRDDSTATLIGATVTLSSDGKKATLNPSADLSRCTWYKATVTTGVKDKAGNALDQDPNATGNQPKEWTFKTRGC